MRSGSLVNAAPDRKSCDLSGRDHATPVANSSGGTIPLYGGLLSFLNHPVWAPPKMLSSPQPVEIVATNTKQ